MPNRDLQLADRVVLAIVIPLALHLTLAIIQFSSGKVVPLASEMFACSVGVWILRRETQTHPGLLAAGIVVMMCLLLFISMAVAVTLVGV